MKKLLAIILSILAICSFTVGLTACGGGEQGDVKSFTLYSDIEIEKYDTFNALKTIDGSASYLQWKTSNKKVATVDDGVIQALSEGTAKITATAGDLKVETTVTVNATNKVPTLSLNKDEVSLLVGNDVVITGHLSFNGKAKLGEYSFFSADESIATVTKDGKITAVKVGETTVSVIAKFADYSTVKKVNVKVIKDAVLKLNAYSVDLKLNGVVDQGKETFTITPTAYLNNQVVTASSYVFASENPEVATIDVNGVIRGVKEGQTTITVSATIDGASYVEKVSVATTKSVVNLKLDSFEAYKSVNGNIRTPNDLAIDIADYNLSESELATAKATYTKDDVTGNFTNSNLAYSADKKVCNLSGRQFGSEIYGDDFLITYTADTLIINVEVGTIVTKYISNKTDFENIIAYGNGNRQVAGIPYNGYFVMTNNIDLNGTISRREPGVDYKANAKVTENSDYASGFRGVFDGQGYTLYNYRFESDKGGLFGNVHKKGVVKNLGVKATFVIKDSTVRSGIFGNQVTGAISNCYVEIVTELISGTTGAGYGILGRETSQGVFSDIVIKADVTNRGIYNFSAIGYKINPWPNYWEFKAVVHGVYLFATEELKAGEFGAQRADGSYYIDASTYFSLGYDEAYMAAITDTTYWVKGASQPIFISAQG